VLGKRCQGIGGAVVEVWYAGLNPHPDRCHCNVPNDTRADYCYTTSTDPYPTQLHPDAVPQNPEFFAPQMCYDPNHWYRGKTTTNAEGKYQFLASMVGQYPSRKIVHYHFKVTTNVQSHVTQIYFKEGER